MGSRPDSSRAGNGLRTCPLAAMLSVHCVRHFYNLSNSASEDLLYEVESVVCFAGPRQDKVAVLDLRHLLEPHELGEALFADINRNLAAQGLRLRESAIADASLFEAPKPTKNRARRRYQEMRQKKKGAPWPCRMKAHFGRETRVWGDTPGTEGGMALSCVQCEGGTSLPACETTMRVREDARPGAGPAAGPVQPADQGARPQVRRA